MSIPSYFRILICLAGLALHAQNPPANRQDIPAVLKTGAQAPDFNLPGTDGAMHSLEEYASSKVLVVIFTCNHCPIAENYEPRIKALAADYHDRSVALVAINQGIQLRLSLGCRNTSHIQEIRARLNTLRICLRPRAETAVSRPHRR